ncbi:MAG: hypothetical protein KDI10_07870 [Halioglobus sp.]|nr:hypothetical protein [Halioglobus sp.]MCB1708631.1 hypothetical protein [Halioglobus sp.]MCP5122567.1 hypothetical protein [Pseudomonadales bacterium]MCP5191734.1 hypothetical protein [Pseudomonadales bacterium]
MKKSYFSPAWLLLALVALAVASRGYAGFGTTVPVTAETATNIARSLFPVSLKAGDSNLYLTDPVVVFIDDRRIGLQAHLQAYDHRPEQGIAISEEGQAVVSGEVGYDTATKQILLHEPRIDKLVFDTQSEVTKRLRAEVLATWESQVTNPIRAEVPPHPFLTPFKGGIRDVTYEQRSIFILVWYP